jgi:hypothetical protein
VGREGEEPPHRRSIKQEGKVVKGSFQEIADIMVADEKNKLMEPSAHNILIYNDLKAFREIYSQCSRAVLPENEIVVIATQYDTTSDVKNTLRLGGIDVEKYLNRALFIVDAQQRYQDAGGSGIWKLYKSLISRAKKEDRRGVTFFGDLGSFFGFEKIEELMQYELSLPQKYEDTLKGICCYHLKDFENLSETQQQTLFDHHFKSMSVE